MTLDEIAAKPKEFLTCAEVAPIIGVKPYDLHMQIMEDQFTLGFASVVVGRRVKIPKRQFLNMMGYYLNPAPFAGA